MPVQTSRERRQKRPPTRGTRHPRHETCDSWETDIKIRAGRYGPRLTGRAITRWRSLWVVLLLSLWSCAPLENSLPGPTSTAALPAASPTSPPTQPPVVISPAPRPSFTPTASALAPATAAPPAFQLAALRMFNTDIGWALATLPWRVLRTSDGGRHWQAVTPPGANPNGNTTAFFLDEEDGWLIVPQSAPDITKPIAATPWHTVDGGVTWTRGHDFSYVGDNAGGDLTFIDARHGWYRANLGGGAGTWYSALFGTTDGGRQWDEAMVNSASPPATASPGSFLPCAINGLAFLDTARGWAAGTCLGPDPAFNATQDGGRTWQPRKLSLPADDTGPINCQGCALFPPVFTSPLHGVVLAMMISPKYGALAYVTNDAGQTWQPYGLGQLIVEAPDFVNVAAGWFLGRGYAGDTLQLYATRDGGVSWTAVQSNIPPGAGIDFVTERKGWTWSPDGLLLETEDGGATWNEINAVLSSRQT